MNDHAFVRQNIEFPARDGVVLRGWLYLPANADQPLPAISMCHGFAAVRGHSLENFAQAFVTAGFAVLVHDHRSFGTSDGIPRHDIDPGMQLEDWRSALTFLEAVAQIDPKRIGIWGTSYSGGHALVLAATDRRVKCVVSQVPTISGYEQGKRRISPDAEPAFLELLLNDQRAQHRGVAPQYQAVASSDLQTAAAYRSAEAVSFYADISEQAGWENTVTLRSTFNARMYEPGIWITRISPTPLLMVIAKDDRITMTDLELAAFEQALPPKKLTLIEGSHFAPYKAEFAASCSAATDWFRTHLNITQ